MKENTKNILIYDEENKFTKEELIEEKLIEEEKNISYIINDTTSDDDDDPLCQCNLCYIVRNIILFFNPHYYKKNN